MPNANYYREQARLLLKWALAASDKEVAERLTHRAKAMLELAERTDATASQREDAFDIFNTSQMTKPIRRKANSEG